MQIIKAELGDLQEILTLQKLAYQSEAELVNDYTITPLTQTLEGMTVDYNSGIMLKAVDDNGSIIGSVRGKFSGNTLYIGRLIVEPSQQNKGIGTALLSAIEALYPSARYELYTSAVSDRNLYLYTKNGYKEFKREPLNENASFVFLEKEPK